MATKTRMQTLLVISILLTVIPLAAWNPANSLLTTHTSLSVSTQLNTVVSSSGALFSTPGPDLGITNWTHNHIEDGGLETWSSPQNHEDWGIYRTPDRYNWFATEPPDHVSEGTYSAGLQTRTTSSSIGTTYWYQTSVAADMQNLTLDFDWYAGPMPDLNYDYFMVYFQLSDGRLMYYYLAGGNSIILANSTFSGIYQFYGPINIWQNLYRNITSDYLAIPGFPSTIAPGLVLNNIYFLVQAGTALNQWVGSFFDDVKLENETTTYIGGPTRNGNLETGTFSPWFTPGSSDESYVSQSSTAHTGSFCGNITTASTGNMSFAQLYQYPRVRITKDNPGNFSVWWNLEQDHVQYYDYAMLHFQFTNFTDNFRIYYIIGYGDLFPWSNFTTDYYLYIDGFNTTGSWQYFECNLWQEISTLFGVTDAIVDNFFITTRANNPNSRVQVLIDDVQLIARATSFADFEDQGDPGTPIYGWDEDYSSDVTVTDQGYVGGKAANCSLGTFMGVHLEQDLHRRPLNSTRETYFDLMWRIEDFTDGRIMFHIRFSDGRILWYVLAAANWAGMVNDSFTAYFNVTGIGTTGSWIQLHRDLVHDYQAAFTSLPDVTMRELDFNADALTGPLEVLFDEIYIYDDPAPILGNVNQIPITPEHEQAVQVEVDIIEQDLDTPFLIYRINSGSFNFLIMSYQTGNTYRATIPGQVYDTLLEYFFQANDTWGMESTLQEGLTYFSYTVDDLTNPNLDITAPSAGAEISGTVNIDVTATDDASGMDRVEFNIGGTLMNTDSSTPYSYAWDSTTVADGDYDISISAFDNAGNEAVVSISITVNNGGTIPPPPPIPGFPFEAIIVGLVTSLGIIFMIRRRRQEP
ncbi:MAG: Loki-CTERM sorting domain-containing protein [Candidatus Hermodarchaeota archaeon]